MPIPSEARELEPPFPRRDLPDTRSSRHGGCESCATYRRALLDVVDTLKQTKSAFKSKTLAALRCRIERVLDTPPPGPSAS
jgi:hypothetical protein